jgi:DNA-binding beta-propeller fold protein YncE
MTTRLAAGLVVAAALLSAAFGGTRKLEVPACTRSFARAAALPGVATSKLALPGQPFGVAADGRYAFVTIGGLSAFPQLGVVDLRRWRLAREIALPVDGAAGVAFTPDRTRLLVAAGSGVTIVNVRAAERGHGRVVAGSLSSGGVDGDRRWSAIEVVTDRNGRYAFVSLEYAARIEVFDLRRRRRVGAIPARAANVGLALSPDGDTLYATSAASAFPLVAGSQGTLEVVDVARAERDPAHSVVTTASVGCDPVRVAATGRDVWVSDRGADAVVELSAKALRAAPQRALEAVVHVGAAPVGLEPFDGGRRLLVLDSDRFDVAGVKPNLAVVDTARRKVVGAVRTGAFPREAARAGDRLLVTDYDGAQLQSVRILR